MVVSQSTAGIHGTAAASSRAATIAPSVIAESPKKSSIRRLSPLSFRRCSSVMGPSPRMGSRVFPPRRSAGMTRQVASQQPVTMTSAATAPDMMFGSVPKALARA